jgi:hypothetical protein
MQRKFEYVDLSEFIDPDCIMLEGMLVVKNVHEELIYSLPTPKNFNLLKYIINKEGECHIDINIIYPNIQIVRIMSGPAPADPKIVSKPITLRSYFWQANEDTTD